MEILNSTSCAAIAASKRWRTRSASQHTSMGADIFRFHVGDFRCVAILDGTFRYLPSLFFANVPKDAYEPRLSEHAEPVATIEVPISVFSRYGGTACSSTPEPPVLVRPRAS